MNSSGIKRGMAALAITAVAVAGIPALAGTAFADPINDQVNEAPGLGVNDAQLYNNQDITAKPDGTDSTVRLEAGAGDNVQEIRFQYRLTAFSALTTIATVARNDDGAFSTEWTPTEAPFNLPVGTVLFSISAQPLNGGLPTAPFDFAAGVEILGAGPNINSINVTADTDRGTYDGTDGACANGPINVAVNGTSSVSNTGAGDRPAFAWMEGDGNAYNSQFVDSSATRAVTGGGTTWAGVLDITAGPAVGQYEFSPAFPVKKDELVVRATTDKTSPPQPDLETNDFESYTLYQQTITTVTATNDHTSTLPDPANITITVLDQSGQPVGDAEVRRGSDNAFLGLTNGLGQVYTTQAPTAAVPTDFYYADQTCTPGYSPAAGDKRSATVVVDLAGSITITSNPEGTVRVGSSVTETATVRNHEGVVQPNVVVRIRRTGPGATQDVQFLTTNAAGQVTYTFACNTTGNAEVQAAFDDPSSGPIVTPPADVIYDRFATDTVSCGNVVPVKKKINPSIKSKNVSGGDDLITVRAKAANGAAVKIFKIVGRNRQVQVGSGHLNANGVLKVTVTDTNGSDLTAYKAVVSATSDTKRGVTNRAQQAKTI